ncbi:MAG: hypothetical protein KY396_07740 [Actinobacteria bacterium]|nr:hypothetical protein [Actinomycetota bacterium]
MEPVNHDLAANLVLTSGIAFLMVQLAREHRLLEKVERTRRCAACGVDVPRNRSCPCSR